MPLYEFACQGCDARFEELLPMDAPVPSCRRCGGARVIRLVSLFAAPSTADGGGCACGGACACGRR